MNMSLKWGLDTAIQVAVHRLSLTDRDFEIVYVLRSTLLPPWLGRVNILSRRLLVCHSNEN